MGTEHRVHSQHRTNRIVTRSGECSAFLLWLKLTMAKSAGQSRVWAENYTPSRRVLSILFANFFYLFFLSFIPQPIGENY